MITSIIISVYNIMKSVEQFYYIILSLTYFIYITTFIGLLNFAPEWLETLQFIFNLYVALILLVRFHPWRKYKFTLFDQKIIFSAALFLLSTIFANKITRIYNTFKNHKKTLGDQLESSCQL